VRYGQSSLGVKRLIPAVFVLESCWHKFDFGLVANRTCNNWRPVERHRLSNGDVCFWQDLCSLGRVCVL